MHNDKLAIVLILGSVSVACHTQTPPDPQLAAQRDPLSQIQLPITRGVLLPESVGARIIVGQVSRAPVIGVERTWRPSPDEVARLDAAASQYLLAHWRAPAESMGRPLVATDYLRQYLGIVRSGQRLIYVNGFSPYHYRVRVLEYRRSPSSVPAGASDAESFWQVEPVIVADGGWDFFGCWYDPTTGEFSGLQFNNENAGG